jgi:hypothetical protein
MPRRRAVLAGMGAAVTGGLAGCLAAGAPENCRQDRFFPPEGMVLVNYRDAAVTVEVTVLQEFLVYTRTVFEETYELPAGGDAGAERTVTGVATRAGPHVVAVSVDGGEPRKLFWQVTTDECESLSVEVTDGGVSVSEPY